MKQNEEDRGASRPPDPGFKGALLALLIGVTIPAVAQDVAAPPHLAGPRLPRAAAPTQAFAVVPWFAIQPENTYQAAPAHGVDLAVHDNGESMTVYEDVRRPKRDLGRRFDLGTALRNDAAAPIESATGEVGGACAGSAYRTIGGQPAKGVDLIGGLGAGRC